MRTMSFQGIANSTASIGGCSDRSFGPASCARDFDFTLTFEQSILSILPSAILLVLTPWRLFVLSRRRSKTQPNKNLAFKTIAATFNLFLQLALVVLWSKSGSAQTSTSVPAASLSLANAIMILSLSYAEDKKSTKPSTLLNVYLLFAVLFDATQVRTLWLKHRNTIAAVQSASIGIKLIMLFFEAQTKRRHLRAPYKDYPPEATSGVINLSFVWWLNSLFVTGFRKLIASEDLFNIDRGLKSEALAERLQSVWEQRTKPETRLSLPKAVAWCFRLDFLASMVPRTFLIGCNFAQPFLIGAAIGYLEDERSVDKNHGYGLIGATLLIYLGIAISTVHYKQIFSRLVTKFRGAVISLLYNHTLILQEGASTESAAITLMSVDTDAIIQYLETINDVWANVIEIGVGIWLLDRQLGATCIVPLALSLVCAAGQTLVSKNIGNDQQAWNQAIQERVKNTSSMLGSMKAIKMSGLAKLLSSNVQGERVSELRTSRPFFWTIIWINGFAKFPLIFSPVITFIVFTIQAKIRGTDPLSTVQAFTSLSIITLVTGPVQNLLAVLPQIVATLGCFERLQAYLLNTTREDTRQGMGQLKSSSHVRIASSSDNILSTLRGTPVSKIAVEVSNATVNPSATSATAAVQNLSLTVETGSLTIILGPVGLGKTTLLKAMLGELPCVSGSISVSSTRMSYCSQSAWLLNVTVKESICGPGNPNIDDEWYGTVVHVCALEEDIRQWPEGDQSVLGSKGMTLSGGQKQRVALARAVYARQDIMLLDDVLSALDARTQDVIITRLFSPGSVLRRLQSTVILVTHSTRCLDLAQNTVVLSSNGSVAMQGNYTELKEKDQFRHLATIQHRDVPEAERPAASQESDSGVAPEDEPGNPMELSRHMGDMSIYLYYIRTVGVPIWAAFFLVQAASAFSDNFPQVWLNWWTNSGGEQLSLYLTVYIALALCSLGLLCIGMWLMFLELMPKSALSLHKKLLDTVMSAPVSFFASTDTGVTLNRFSQDMSLVDMALPIALFGVVSSFFDCIAKLVLISTGSSYMAITIPFTLLAIYLVQDVYLRTSRQLRYLDLEYKSPLYSHFLETLDGLATIRAFGWEYTARKTQSDNLDRSQQPYYMLLCVQRWLNLVLDLMVAAVAVIVMTLAVQLRSTTSAGLLGIALNNVLGFNKSLSTLVMSWTQLETSLGAIARTKTFTETTTSEKKPGENFEVPEDWPSNGEIKFNNVSATYGDSIRAFDGISMSINPGQKIGICGRTGSGKSSLILTLLRLVEISSGTITIDGIDISTIPREVLRQRLIAISQDPFIVSGSVRGNVDPAGTSLDSAIVSALTRIGIWSALESRGGLDAVLEDQPLSQGQQQLLCLARAMLRKSKVLILDEATSNVDSETDRVMQRVIKEEFQGYTIISVAHRLDTIMDADKIAVLDAGKLVEFDNPKKLLAKGGPFAQMYRD